MEVVRTGGLRDGETGVKENDERGDRERRTTNERRKGRRGALEKTLAAHWGFSILRVPSSKDFQETKTPRRRATSPVETQTLSTFVPTRVEG